jgi:hypothetical protein
VRIGRWTGHVVLLAILVGVVGCTSWSGEEKPPAHSARTASPDREEQADWAVGMLDPCRLMSHVPGLIGGRVAESPRACAAMFTNGRQLAVHIGDPVTHFARSRAIAESAGGLRSYRLFDTGFAGAPPICQIGLPLSFTRGIWIFVTPGQAKATGALCDNAREAAAAVAEVLRENPLSAARSNKPGSPQWWDMCSLRDAALGRPEVEYPPDGVGVTDLVAQADQCHNGGAPDGADLDLAVTTGLDPAQAVQPEPGTHRVELPGETTGLEYRQSTSCALAWAQERVTSDTAYVLTLRANNGRCPSAADARKVIATLANPPRLPRPLERLGFTRDERDERFDQVCRIAEELPKECRAPREVQIPAGADAIMRAAAGEDGHDIACAMLATAMQEVLGQAPLLARTDSHCVGTPPDRTFTLELALVDHVPQDFYTNPPRPVLVAGYPAIEGGNDETFRALEVSPYRDLGRAGDVSVSGGPVAPLGALPTGSSTADPARLSAVNRIAESVMRTYFP